MTYYDFEEALSVIHLIAYTLHDGRIGISKRRSSEEIAIIKYKGEFSADRTDEWTELELEEQLELFDIMFALFDTPEQNRGNFTLKPKPHTSTPY